MRLNADFSRRASVRPEEYRWICSPQSGVERVMLDRIGEEKARATSLVRYQPGSAFPVHHHPGGEEIFVISGTFSEGDRHYPAGWYLRNPDGSSHAPSSHEGAVIFVKLRQMHAGDDRPIRINTADRALWLPERGRRVCPLYRSAYEEVSLQRVEPGERLFSRPPAGGAELLVLDGELTDATTDYRPGAWLRFPAGALPPLTANPAGVCVWIKTGHLHPDTLAGVHP